MINVSLVLDFSLQLFFIQYFAKARELAFVYEKFDSFSQITHYSYLSLSSLKEKILSPLSYFERNLSP